METTEQKKHKSGFALLKEKLAKAEAKIAELEAKHKKEVGDLYVSINEKQDTIEAQAIHVRGFSKKIDELQTTIEQQSRKISQLTADLKVAQGDLKATDREHERQLKAMYDHMGWFKRMTWDWHHAPTFKEDERWNETH